MSPRRDYQDRTGTGAFRRALNPTNQGDLDLPTHQPDPSRAAPLGHTRIDSSSSSSGQSATAPTPVDSTASAAARHWRPRRNRAVHGRFRPAHSGGPEPCRDRLSGAALVLGIAGAAVADRVLDGAAGEA